MKKMRTSILFLTCLTAFADDWTRFRGPNGTGISPDKNLPSEISKDRNVVWSQKTPKGHSSPIVADGRIFFTGYEGDNRLVQCYSADSGKLLWSREIPKLRTEVANPNNGPSTPTPVADDSSVYIFFPEIGLLSYDFNGKEKWRVPLGPFGGVQGMASSPIVVEGKVILLVDTPEQAYLAAFAASTGKQVWKLERPVGFLGSYATPSVWKGEIIVAGAGELTAYQPATGERLWWARGVTFAPATLPLIAGDSIYTAEPNATPPPPFKQMLDQYDKRKEGKIRLADVSDKATGDAIMLRIFKAADKVTGNNDGILTEDEWNRAFDPKEPAGGLVRTKAGGKGDVTSSNVAWKYTKGIPYTSSPILYRDVLYLIRNGGILQTFDPASGKLFREERLKDAIGDYYAQPVAGDGKIYFISRDGKTTVLRASADWEKLSSGDLSEDVVATPAIAGSRIYVRTESTLYCFGVPVQN
jgi:outer membrane protein assembly factor BamB